MTHDNKLLAVAQHLCNLCRTLNQISEADTSTYRDYGLAFDRLKSACNMAKTTGYNSRIWVDPLTDRVVVVEVHDTETDECVAIAVDKTGAFPYMFRQLCEPVIDRGCAR